MPGAADAPSVRHNRAVSTRYPWLIFDADDTLFDFRRAEGEALREAFEAAGVPFVAAWLPVYRTVNGRAWRALEEGRSSPAELRVWRFEELFAELGLTLDPVAFGSAYLGRLAMQPHLVEGALDLIESLRPDHLLAIVTNGIADVQRSRFAASPIAEHIAHLVISEEVGAAKPDPAIFEVALDLMGRPDRRGVLVVGDSLSSDIAGGAACGLDTCWFNPDGLPLGDGSVDGLAPTFEIRRLADLPGLLQR